MVVTPCNMLLFTVDCTIAEELKACVDIETTAVDTICTTLLCCVDITMVGVLV